MGTLFKNCKKGKEWKTFITGVCRGASQWLVIRPGSPPSCIRRLRRQRAARCTCIAIYTERGVNFPISWHEDLKASRSTRAGSCAFCLPVTSLHCNTASGSAGGLPSTASSPPPLLTHSWAHATCESGIRDGMRKGDKKTAQPWRCSSCSAFNDISSSRMPAIWMMEEPYPGLRGIVKRINIKYLTSNAYRTHRKKCIKPRNNSRAAECGEDAAVGFLRFCRRRTVNT